MLHITDGKTWPCKDCKKVFSTRLKLNLHRKYNHESVSEVCELCGAQFKLKKYYDTHMRSAHTGERPFKCTQFNKNSIQCEKTFVSSAGLKEHIKSQHGSEKVKCKLCQKLFKNKGNLKSHMQYVHTEKNKPCTYPGCDFKYSVKSKLDRHIYKKHTDQRRFQCKTCDSTFRDR